MSIIQSEIVVSMVSTSFIKISVAMPYFYERNLRRLEHAHIARLVAEPLVNHLLDGSALTLKSRTSEDLRESAVRTAAEHELGG